MMGLTTIRQMAAEAAERAAEDGQEPYVYWDETEVDDYDRFPFPFLGDYVPEDWELVETHFADSSGLGADDEPALSVRQLKALIQDRITAERDYTVGWAIVQAGQFQVYVGEYHKER